MPVRLLAAALCATALVALSGCGSPPAAARVDGRLTVVASFYPLQLAVEQIGGDHVTVSGLTRPGAEPHDVELTPRQVGRVALSGLVVYLGGFQPAVDAAVRAEASGHSLDVAPAAHLETLAEEHESGHGSGHESGDGSGHDEPGATAATAQPAETGHDHGSADPHFWLDPERYASVATAIGDRLAADDPAHAADYTTRAAAFAARLHVVDREFAEGLAHCRIDTLVTSHSAFGYLAQAYGLTQVGISGLTPDAEPDPAALARLATEVREHHVTTVYAETLASPAVAETLARETGAHLAVLDPIEGISSKSAGRDYFEVMASNLSTLRTGQECT